MVHCTYTVGLWVCHPVHGLPNVYGACFVACTIYIAAIDLECGNVEVNFGYFV